MAAFTLLVMDRLSVQTHAPSTHLIFILHGRACLRAAEHTDVKRRLSVSTHTARTCVPCAGAPVGDWLWCYLLVNCDQHLNTLTPRRVLEELLSPSSCLPLARRLWRSLKVTHAICKLHRKRRSCSTLSPTLKMPIIQRVQKGFRPSWIYLIYLSLFLMKLHVKIRIFGFFLPHQATLLPHQDSPNPEFKNISNKEKSKRNITDSGVQVLSISLVQLWHGSPPSSKSIHVGSNGLDLT